MFSTYLDCAISIGSSGPDGYPTVVRGPGGDARATIAPFAHNQDFQSFSAQLAALDLDAESIERAGQWLFQQLFHGPIRDVYTRSQGILRDGQGLRLGLNIDESAPEIAALPWELLHDPDQGPLALLDMSVVRYLPHQSAPAALRTELPLKVLLTGAHTSTEDSIEPSLRAVEDALTHLGDYVQITIEPHLTSGKLQQLLRQDFHVWHFVGHTGVGAGANSAQLLLEDAQQPRPVNAQQLNILLKRSGVRLVMLDTIGANGPALEPLRRLAAAVVRAQVPAAIATQFTSPDAVARAFNYEFYRTLAEAFPIDACVTEGRKALMGEVGLDQIDWACPVVYTRAPDGTPAVFVWQPEALGGAKNVDAWRRVRERADPGHSMFWFGGSTEFSYLNEFDALVFFDITWESTLGAAMKSYIGKLKGYPGKPFVGTVMPGYDESRNRPGSTHKIRPHDPDYYRATWNAVIKNCAQAVVITSFNEFKEGSFIEPSQQYGTTYLDITREMSAAYKNSGC